MTLRSLCATLVVMLSILFATATTAQMLTNDELSLDPAQQTEQITPMIEAVFEPLESTVPGIVHKMLDIAECESGTRQLDAAGQIIRGATSDSGVFQILLVTHRPDYVALGLDPRDVSDNILFARFLVKRKLQQGRRNLFEDWVCAL